MIHCDICADFYARQRPAEQFFFTIRSESKKVDVAALCPHHDINKRNFPTVHAIDEDTYIVLKVLGC